METRIPLASIFGGLGSVHPTLALVLVSLATAVFMLFVFRLVSDQDGIRRAKAGVLGQLLAIRLFPDDPWVTVRALGGALRANLWYLRRSLLPLFVMIVPLVLVIVELDLWFGRIPLLPGSSTRVAIVFANGDPGNTPEVALEAPAGLIVETPPLRIPSLHEVDWRVRAVSEGEYELQFRAGKNVASKRLISGSGVQLRRVSPVRVRGGMIQAAINPGESPLDPSAGVESVSIDYPPRFFRILGLELHWIVAYFILSLGFAFVLKKPFGVEV